jgi:hypothetical protein
MCDFRVTMFQTANYLPQILANIRNKTLFDLTLPTISKKNKKIFQRTRIVIGYGVIYQSGRSCTEYTVREARCVKHSVY